MADQHTRDECLKTVMRALDEFIDADVEALFDQASAAVDALVESMALFTAERYDEECHACGQPIRDHLVDGRCPTVIIAVGKITPWKLRPDDQWKREEPDAFDRVSHCWAERCERPATWELVTVGGFTAHEHYCTGHSLERGRIMDTEPADA